MSSSPFWMPIEPRNLRELMKTGYCVIDNFIHDESVAKKMREEMCSMPIRYENEEEEEKEKLTNNNKKKTKTSKKTKKKNSKKETKNKNENIASQSRSFRTETR